MNDTLPTRIFIAFILLVFIAGYSAAHPIPPTYAEASVVDFKPSPTPKGIEIQYSPVEQYVRLKFGIDGERAMTMLRTCENKLLNTTAINWNRNGTWDFGLFQVNQVHGYTQDQLSDYKFNTDVAYEIYEEAGNSFSPWTCAYAIGETPFYLQ